MKIKLLACLLVFLFGLPLMAAPPSGKSAQSAAQNVSNETYVAANRILMFVTNHGNFGRDLAGVFGHDYGTYFPFTTAENIVSGANVTSPYYAGGLWVGAIDSATGDTLTVISEYSSEYVPGPTLDGTFQTDRPEFKVYKLYRDSLASNPNSDYTNWPVEQGAPVNEDGTPKMIGDQMAWSVYNDLDPSNHSHDLGSTAPLGLEVKQTVFAFERSSGSLANCVFIRFQIYNRGDKVLENCMFSIFSDPDLGTAGDDLVGTDTLLDLGFTYNDGDDDQQYTSVGMAVPSVGIDFFQGPLQFTGLDTDTALMWDTVWPGYTNMGLYSFNKYINGADPDSYIQAYQFMLGLDGKDNGAPIINPVTSEVTRFVMSGDPTAGGCAGSGWLDEASADRRHMQTTGPVTFRPGDSTEILAGMVVGQAGPGTNSWCKSITIMKQIDAFAQRVYENGFNPPQPPAKPVVAYGQTENRITLSWTDTSEVTPGDFEYEGYTVWQGESSSGPWTELVTYDVDNHRNNALIDTLLDLYSGLSLPTAVRKLSNSGISRMYTTGEDAIGGGRLNNVSTYYFKVSAFSFADVTDIYGDTIPNGDKFLESERVVVVVPQAPPAGIDPAAAALDTLEVAHVGPGDGQVLPMVLDPRALNGNTYRVTFVSDGADGFLWNLVNLTTGDTLLANQSNQTGDGDYLSFDGMFIKVVGPSPGVRDWDIPSGDRRFTWANANFGWEGFEGAIGWGDPGSVFGGRDPAVSYLDLPEVLLKLATVDSVGNFDTDDENVSYGYRYMRNCNLAAARPEFAPFIINTGASYDYQAFEKNVPLSAWNMDVNPPQRLAVGFLENNVTLGTLDGVYFPAPSDSLGAWLTDNSAGTGPREWLWIYLDDYSETANPDYQLNAIDDPMPIMYWLTVARRGGSVPFSDDSTGEDQFLIIPARLSTEADQFTWTAPPPDTTLSEEGLADIKAVPNPFYLHGPYDPAVGNYLIKFHHLPMVCSISIYNLAGDFIARIDKNDDSPIAEWNLQSEKQIPVASGIYIYVVDAPGFGQKIGKLAVLYEQEVLTVY